MKFFIVQIGHDAIVFLRVFRILDLHGEGAADADDDLPHVVVDPDEEGSLSDVYVVGHVDQLYILLVAHLERKVYIMMKLSSFRSRPPVPKIIENLQAHLHSPQSSSVMFELTSQHGQETCCCTVDSTHMISSIAKIQYFKTYFIVYNTIIFAIKPIKYHKNIKT